MIADSDLIIIIYACKYNIDCWLYLVATNNIAFDWLKQQSHIKTNTAPTVNMMHTISSRNQFYQYHCLLQLQFGAKTPIITRN